MLRVEGMSFSYGKIQALRDVSFTLERGEIVSIIGANGAGKSTLMKCLAGLQRPQQGSVFFEGEVVNSEPHVLVKKGVTMIPEGRWIFPGMTVEENLRLGGYTVANVKEGLENAYVLFPKMYERRKQRAGTLSGGEQQMLAIGRGLMANPKLLLLDEPSLGLAPIIVNDIIRTIIEINKKGVTVLLVEQNAKKALSISNRAYLLETSSIVKTGTGDELLRDPMIISAYLGGVK